MRTILLGGLWVGMVFLPMPGPSALHAQPSAREASITFFMNSTDGDFGALYLLSGGARHSLAIGAEDETIIIDTKRPLAGHSR